MFIFQPLVKLSQVKLVMYHRTIRDIGDWKAVKASVSRGDAGKRKAHKPAWTYRYKNLVPAGSLDTRSTLRNARR